MEDHAEAYKGEFPPVEWNIWMTLATPMILLSWHAPQIRDKIDQIWMSASRVGLEINAPKMKVVRISSLLDTPLTDAGETLERVDSYTYLGSVISKDWIAQKDIKNRLTKARNAFASLRPVS